jgi:hypothetical protein
MSQISLLKSIRIMEMTMIAMTVIIPTLITQTNKALREVLSKSFLKTTTQKMNLTKKWSKIKSRFTGGT